MTHPIPPGTRDILPDEMRELRRLSVALVEAFERFGYGEVATPTIEYEEVLARGDEEGAAPAYRFFDERGELLHFFTAVVGDRLFFEVLERRGGYDGYGAANSAVRLGAQRETSLTAPSGSER